MSMSSDSNSYISIVYVFEVQLSFDFFCPVSLQAFFFIINVMWEAGHVDISVTLK